MPHCSCVASKVEAFERSEFNTHDHHHDGEGDGFQTSNKAHYAPSTKLEPVHLDISLNFSSAKALRETHTFDAKIVQTIVCNQPARSISFNGVNFSNVQVSDITEGAETNKLNWTYDGNKIEVTFEKNLTKSEVRKIEIKYTVSKPICSVVFNYEKNPILGDYAVTSHETERARYWLACVDYPVVRTTLDFHITVPKEHSAYANGVLTKEEESGDHKTAHYHLAYKCPSYLICFAVGDLVSVDDETVNSKIPVKYIAPRGVSLQDLKLTFDKTPSIIKWLEKRVGVEFPFPKYYQVIVPIITGAMENISLVTWDLHFLVDELLATEYKIITDSINLHECTHSYFGDALVIKHFEHAWTKESWATYMEACWLEEAYSREEMEFELWTQLAMYISETKRYMRPIVQRMYDSSWDLFDSHTYPGGSWRIHMLRNKLGDEVFWNGVNNYVKNNLQQIVETEDFKREMEKASSLNLTKFFDQWFYSKGYPKVKLEYKYNKEQNTVFVAAEQEKQQNVPVFEFDLEVEVTFKNKEVRTIVLSFEDGSARASSLIPCPAAATQEPNQPHMIRVDPGLKVLFELVDFNPGEEMLENALRESKDIFNRIRSGRQLIKIGTKQSVDRVLKCLSTEKFYGVRAQIVSQCSQSKGPYSAALLAEALKSEKENRALMYMTNNAIEYRDERIKESLLHLLTQSEFKLGHVSRARALEAYSTQKFAEESLDELFELIRTQLEKDTRYAYTYVRRGAYRALANVKTQKVLSYLYQQLENEKRDECRPIILHAIANVAAGLTTAEFSKPKTEAAKVLREYLRNSDRETRNFAIQGLLTLEAKGAAEDIKNVKKITAEQYHPWIDKRVKTLQKGAEQSTKEEVTKLKKEVEELKDLLKKLQYKFDDMAATKTSATTTSTSENK